MTFALFFSTVRRSSLLSNTILGLITNRFISNMVLVCDIQKPSIVLSNLKGLDFYFQFCCQAPALMSSKINSMIGAICCHRQDPERSHGI